MKAEAIEMQFKGKMIMHTSGTKQHILKHEITIHCPEHEAHEFVFYREIVTPKISEFEFGKARVIFYTDKPNSKAYKTIKGFLKSESIDISNVIMK